MNSEDFESAGFDDEFFSDEWYEDVDPFDEDKQENKQQHQVCRNDFFERFRFATTEKKQSPMKSSNFEVVYNTEFNFSQVGGYKTVKNELMQCADLLTDYEKYANFSVRVPKGMLLEGPPGNGKTIIARAFSGEIKSAFIHASGSEFQEKYVGVGASRIRELFELANKAKPCIIFIDEIDAIGRRRGSSNENADAERDTTLNQLLTQMDGFKKSNGVFVICATNRADLLDGALTRPGRIDKKLYIGNPDMETRKKIIEIHLEGKPHDDSINEEILLALTNGMSGAEIENLLNEAMLSAIRKNRSYMKMEELESIFGRSVGGWQETANIFSDDMILRIAIHELGHGLAGLVLPAHPRLQSINLNMYSPRTPGYTIFEHDEIDANIFTREKLFSQLVVLLSGRIAEDIHFNHSVTTGASHDFQEAYKLAERMVVQYGMGKQSIFPYASDGAKAVIDNEVIELINEAQIQSRRILESCQRATLFLAELLITQKQLKRSTVETIVNRTRSIDQPLYAS